MEERRLQLRMSWTRLAQEAQISPQALRSIRRGEYRPSRLTAQALDDALAWERGSVERVLAGGEPEVAGEASARLTQQTALTAHGTVEPPARPDTLPEDSAELVRMARRFLDDSREHRRRSEELYSRAEEILRRLTGADESANRDAS